MPLSLGTGILTEISIPLTGIGGSVTTLAATAVAAEAREVLEAAEAVAVDVAAAAEIAVQTAQLVIYYDRFDDAIDARDAKIDAQIAFMTTLEAFKQSDRVAANKKRSVLTDLGLPSVDLCTDSIRFRTQHQGDGTAVDLKATQLATESCDGIPNGWGTHEGSLMAAKSGSYAGGILGNASKRDQEEFRVQRTALVRAGQIGMKGVFRAGDTLAMYAQAASIQSGKADIYLAGFNSAGAGLGTSIGRLGGAAADQTLVGAETIPSGNAAINFQGQGDFGTTA